MAKTAARLDSVSATVQPVAEALSQAMGLPAIPQFGFERKEILEVSKALIRNYKSNPRAQIIRAIGIIAERNAAGEYVTPRRGFWYVCQRMRELYPTTRQASALEKWQREMRAPGEARPQILPQTTFAGTDEI